MIDEPSGDQEQQNGGQAPKTISEPSTQTPPIPTIAPAVQPGPLPDQLGGKAANAKAKQNEEESLKVFERRMLSLTKLGIAVAAITGAIFYVQLRIMSYQTQILADQAEVASANASVDTMTTRQQLVIIQKQMEATQRQAVILERAGEASERPYLGIDNVYFEADKSKYMLTIHTILKNFGNNPAENVVLEWHYYQNGVEIKGTDQPPTTPIKRGIIFPGNPRSLNSVFSNVDFVGFETGQTKWRVKISAVYHWTAKKKYEYCEEWEYSPLTAQFMTMGYCRKKN